VVLAPLWDTFSFFKLTLANIEWKLFFMLLSSTGSRNIARRSAIVFMKYFIPGGWQTGKRAPRHVIINERDGD